MTYEINKIYNEDCLTAMENMPEKMVDLVVTDPPYFIENLKKDLNGTTMRGGSNGVFFDTFDHFKDLADFKSFMERTLRGLKRIMKPKAQCYMFCSYHHIHWLIQMIKDEGFRFYKPLIWYKHDVGGLFPNQYHCSYEPILWFRNDEEGGTVKLRIGCAQRDVFNIKSINMDERNETGDHPTPKPKKLIRQLILNGSDRGDLVFDGFVGSGTTPVCAKEVGRNYLGFELDEKYMPVIAERLQQETLKYELETFIDADKL